MSMRCSECSESCDIARRWGRAQANLSPAQPGERSSVDSNKRRVRLLEDIFKRLRREQTKRGCTVSLP